jgi:hypothetical protein
MALPLGHQKGRPAGKVNTIPMVEGFGNALTRTNAGIKTVQEYADRLWAGVQEQREWLQEVVNIIRDIQDELNALLEP